jgi:hypothetical protein
MYLQPVVPQGCSIRAGRSASGFAALVLAVTEIARFSVLPLLADLLEDRLNRRSAFFGNFVLPFP